MSTNMILCPPWYVPFPPPPPPPPPCSSISRGLNVPVLPRFCLPHKLLHHSRRWRRLLGFSFLSAGWNRVPSDVCSLRRSSLLQCPRCSAFLDLNYHLYQVFYLLNPFVALCCWKLTNEMNGWWIYWLKNEMVCDSEVEMVVSDRPHRSLLAFSTVFWTMTEWMKLLPNW